MDKDKFKDLIEAPANYKERNTISLRSDNDDWVRKWYQRIGFEVKSSNLWLIKKI